MIITLNKADVIKAAKEAFDKGELQIQNPAPNAELGGCRYGGPCVIGAAMTQEQREYCDTIPGTLGSPAIQSLIQRGIVVTDDRDFLVSLQNNHDRGCSPSERRVELTQTLKGMLDAAQN
jgi:hypothetical protein